MKNINIFRKGILLMILLILIFSGCHSKTVSTSNEFNLTNEEIKELKIKANQGGINAAEKLANYYIFVDYNLEEVVKYLRIVAETGDTSAQYNLAYHLLIPSNDSIMRKEGVYWLRISANSGEQYAQKYLANLYETGDIVEKNYYNAKYWYEKAAISGSSYSVEKLAEFYLEGIGCDRNKIKAYAILSFVQQSIEKTSAHYKEIENKKKK
ncbi:MAG: tetratricopeptide repeat protein [Pseudomonadota bacterium]